MSETTIKVTPRVLWDASAFGTYLAEAWVDGERVAWGGPGTTPDEAIGMLRDKIKAEGLPFHLAIDYTLFPAFRTFRIGEKTYLAFPVPDNRTAFAVVGDGGENYGGWWSVAQFRRRLAKGEVEPVGWVEVSGRLGRSVTQPRDGAMR
jgi:hypothetical protein